MQKILGAILTASLIAATFLRPLTPLADDKGVETLVELPLEELAAVNVTSVATGTEKPIREVPAMASVITEEDIKAMGATTLEEVLESIPGIHVSYSGEIYEPKFLIRGIGSSRYNPETLRLVNGIPVANGATGDTLRLGILPVKLISRVEVIRGPGSALYGADAFSGMVNVVTKSATELHGTVGGGGIGSFNSHRAWLLQGEQVGDLKLTLMADYSDTAGHRGVITQDAQTRLDQVFGTQASLAPGPVSLSEKSLGLFVEMEKSRWRLRGFYYGKSDVGEGQGRAQALSPQGRLSLARENLDLTYHDPRLGADWDFTSQLSYQHFSHEVDQASMLFPPGANLGRGVFPEGALGNPEFWERQVRFQNSVVYTGLDQHRLRFGVGYLFDHLYRVQNTKNSTTDFAPLPEIVDVTDTSQIYLPERSRSSFFGYGQDEWQFADDWELTTGLRYDRYSDFGETLNPRAALVWKATAAQTWKLLYGRAFRAPTFLEAYGMNNLVALGNANLKPETLDFYELGWAYQLTSGWHAGVNLYHYWAKDLINFVKDPNGTTATAQNSGTQRGNGFGIETRSRLSEGWWLSANYSMVFAKDVNSGKPAGRAPGYKVYGRLDGAFNRDWIWNTQLTWIGTREREPADARAPLKGYATVDLVLRRKNLFNRVELMATVRNLFNADVREPSEGPGPTVSAAAIPNDLPQAGRSAYAELAYRF